MRPQHNRLPESKAFSGLHVDRSLPIQFRLDGRLVSGFAGDTVLSALLASGIDTVGDHLDAPVALTSAAAPAILPVSHADGAEHALPMERMPVLDGAEFATLGARRGNPILRVFQPGRTLGLALDQLGALARPWRTWPAETMPEQDIVVVGGGVAGLSAALAAARAGLKVSLFETGLHLGGNSGLFGTQEGEEAPEACMTRLSAEVAANPAISVFTGSEVFAARSGMVRAHIVTSEGNEASGRVVDLPTRFVVLATGARERLPLFAGNRLPGVMGSQEAYELGRRFGVWPGQSAALYTASNPAYRVSLAASDAGISVVRLLDPRPTPNSRFIAFTRAHGMRHATGTRIATVEQGGRHRALSILTDAGEGETLTADRLIVCGGWQPDLTLWHVAGGQSRWDKTHARLKAVGDLDGIVLAGSAAGYFTRTACIQSGADAVDRLLGRTRQPVVDRLIEPLYETPDASAIGPATSKDSDPTYLDAGTALLVRPQEHKRNWKDWFRPARQTGLTALSEAPQPLTVTAVLAGVELGLIPTEAAGAVAQERVALVPLPAFDTPEAGAEVDDTPEPGHVPAYLRGRFGPDERLATLLPDQPRRLEPGMLIFRSSDTVDPMRAIGVVLRTANDGGIALVAAEALASGLPVSLRDADRSISARLTPWSA